MYPAPALLLLQRRRCRGGDERTPRDLGSGLEQRPGHRVSRQSGCTDGEGCCTQGAASPWPAGSDGRPWPTNFHIHIPTFLDRCCSQFSTIVVFCSFNIKDYRFYHDLSLAIFSESCVFSNGRGFDVNIDSHRGGACGLLVVVVCVFVWWGGGCGGVCVWWWWGRSACAAADAGSGTAAGDHLAAGARAASAARVVPPGCHHCRCCCCRCCCCQRCCVPDVNIDTPRGGAGGLLLPLPLPLLLLLLLLLKPTPPPTHLALQAPTTTCSPTSSSGWALAPSALAARPTAARTAVSPYFLRRKRTPLGDAFRAFYAASEATSGAKS